MMMGMVSLKWLKEVIENSASVSPASRASAIKCSTAFVEPPIAYYAPPLSPSRRAVRQAAGGRRGRVIVFVDSSFY